MTRSALKPTTAIAIISGIQPKVVLLVRLLLGALRMVRVPEATVL